MTAITEKAPTIVSPTESLESQYLEQFFKGINSREESELSLQLYWEKLDKIHNSLRSLKRF
jgi:hypothetical protein